jgi:hypothetical protein
MSPGAPLPSLSPTSLDGKHPSRLAELTGQIVLLRGRDSGGARRPGGLVLLLPAGPAAASASAERHPSVQREAADALFLPARADGRAFPDLCSLHRPCRRLYPTHGPAPTADALS